MKNILVSIIIIFIIIGILFSIKLFIIDPYLEKEKRTKIIALINDYYNKEEYNPAKSFAEELLLKDANDKEIIDLYNKILKAEEDKEKAKEAERLDKENQEKERLNDLIRRLMNKLSKSLIASNKPNIDQSSDIKNNKYSNNPALNNIINEGIRLFIERKNIQAKSRLQEAIKIDDANPYANAYLGTILFEENPEDISNLSDVIKMCNKAIESNSKIEIASYTLARVYEVRGLKDEAIEKYKETLKINPNNYEVNFILGKIYYKNNEYDRAREQFKNAVEVKKDYVNAYYYLANTEANLNNLNDAIAYYEKVIDLNPEYYDAYYELGKTYLYLQKKEEAKIILTKLIYKSPDYTKRDDVNKMLEEIK